MSRPHRQASFWPAVLLVIAAFTMAPDRETAGATIITACAKKCPPTAQ